MKQLFLAVFSIRFYDSRLNDSILPINHRHDAFVSRSLEMRSSSRDTCDLCRSTHQTATRTHCRRCHMVQTVVLPLFSEQRLACSSHTVTNANR